jgi:hypothetical protein
MRAAGLQNKADYAAEALAVGEVKRWETGGRQDV